MIERGETEGRSDREGERERQRGEVIGGGGDKGEK